MQQDITCERNGQHKWNEQNPINVYSQASPAYYYPQKPQRHMSPYVLAGPDRDKAIMGKW